MTNDGTGRPRVVSIVNTFPSPSETFIERKARALISAGFDVTVAARERDRSSDGSVGPPVPRLQLPSINAPRTWTPSVAALFKGNATPGRAAPLLRQFRAGHWLAPVAAGGYDIIHFEFSGIAANAADVLPLLRPARLAVSCRGAAEQIAPYRDPERARRLERVFAEVDLIHCVSDDMADTVKGFGAPDDKIVVNRPAVDTERWAGVGHVDTTVRGTPEAPLRVLSVARLHWKKAFDDAIRAVAAARDSGLHIEYRIAGEGPELEKLLYLRHSLDVEDEVELLGWQSQADVRKLLGWADVFLLPSLSEGISNSALEAMAAGVPVISTRCGGMAEALSSPDSGVLVSIGKPDEIAAALSTLTAPGRRQTLSNCASATARDHFDLSRQAAVFADAYRRLLAKGDDVP